MFNPGPRGFCQQDREWYRPVSVPMVDMIAIIAFSSSIFAPTLLRATLCSIVAWLRVFHLHSNNKLLGHMPAANMLCATDSVVTTECRGLAASPERTTTASAHNQTTATANCGNGSGI